MATDAINRLIQNPATKFATGLGLYLRGHLLEKGSKSLGASIMIGGAPTGAAVPVGVVIYNSWKLQQAKG